MGRGSELEDISILVGLGIVGFMAYLKYFPNKSFDEVLQDIDTRLKGFLDTIKLPALPPIPTLSMPTPQIPQAAAAPPTPTTITIPPAPTPPSSEEEPEPTGLPEEATNTIPEEDEPVVTEPPAAKKPPKSQTGQLAKNPEVPPPPAGSGGAIVAFAGDFDSNNKTKQTVATMEKNNVGYIVGCGDYSYGPAASTWFNEYIGARFKGKMKGALGNHDNDSYLQVFGQTGWNVAQQVAPNLTVVFIDTEKGISESTLTSLTKSAQGQSKHVAYAMHKPYITSSNGHHKGSENKSGSIIDKVAKAMGIKLVVSGHNHIYEHFSCGGIHYVTSGAAGRDFYSGNCQGCAAGKCANNTNGFLKVSVGASLLCQFVTNAGSVQDSFQIS